MAKAVFSDYNFHELKLAAMQGLIICTLLFKMCKDTEEANYKKYKSGHMRMYHRLWNKFVKFIKLILRSQIGVWEREF